MAGITGCQVSWTVSPVLGPSQEGGKQSPDQTESKHVQGERLWTLVSVQGKRRSLPLGPEVP